uniref:NADH-ubiquinone oxidoreductase 12 kDa subunit n=2 Tax=Ostreococcus mediterraneus TaxID=1486918 RepID=A0A7S0WIM7_9CHLO
MVNTSTKAGASTTLPSGPAALPKAFDASAPYADPLALIEARETNAREQMVRVERAKILRDRVIECYRIEGVNHLENCKATVGKYLESIKDVGVHRLNFGEHDRGH